MCKIVTDFSLDLRSFICPDFRIKQLIGFCLIILIIFQFQEILKPNYNSVDFSEVELVYDPKHDEPRHNNSNLFAVREENPTFISFDITLLQMRKDMVDQKEGMGSMRVKVHMDDMKRVTVRDQDYFYYNISNTPFTLGIALPNMYGKYRVRGGMEVNQQRIDGECYKDVDMTYRHYSSQYTVS